MVTPFSSHGSICELFKKRFIRFLTEDELAEHAHAIFSAVKAIHSKGYLHRVIRPDNILVNYKQDGRVQVILGGLSSCITIAESTTEELD